MDTEKDRKAAKIAAIATAVCALCLGALLLFGRQRSEEAGPQDQSLPEGPTDSSYGKKEHHEWIRKLATDSREMERLDDLTDSLGTDAGRAAARKLLREKGFSEDDIQHGLDALDRWRKRR